MKNKSKRTEKNWMQRGAVSSIPDSDTLSAGVVGVSPVATTAETALAQ